MATTLTWITGLSGSGKSTLAVAWLSRLRAMGLTAVLLDGDELRTVFDDCFGYTKEERLKASLHYARLCQLLTMQGVHVVCATISLFHETQAWNQKNIENYFEVYLKVPQEVLLQRDTKDIYKKALNGELSYVVGVDIEPEVPKTPDLLIDHDINYSCDDLLKTVEDRFLKKFNKAFLSGGV